MSKRKGPSSQKISMFFHPEKTQKINDVGDEHVVPVVPPQVVPQVVQVESDNVAKESEVALTFERDPGLRRQIHEYPKEQWNEVRREYLKIGPYQWSLVPDDYPLTKAEGDRQNRKFNPSWYGRFPWLEYSPDKDRAYCLPCFLFEKNPPRSETYTVNGFKSWKRISRTKECSFSQHVGVSCSPHNIAVSSCENLMKPSRQINNILRVRSQEEVTRNRLRVEATIRCVRWLALQGCAFRGNDESLDSENCGNFIELLKFIGELNSNIGSVTMGNAPGNATYTSPLIQEQVLHLLADSVRKQIRKEIGNAKFCILVDEAQDSSTHEQMGIIIRFVDNAGLVQERFFCNFGGSKHKCIHSKEGQGYDGASNMRGAWNGLQALILKDCPQAYYVHCFAHRLQLALVAASNDVHGVWLFFSKLTSIVNFVNASPKRKTEVEDLHKLELKKMIDNGEIGTGRGANQMVTLQRGGTTRWSSHFSSVRSMIAMYSAVGIFLSDLSTSGSTNAIRGGAKGEYLHMRSFDFVFHLHLMHKTMGITNVLCKALQEKSQDIINAISLVSTTKTLLQKLRAEGWEDFVAEVLAFCTKYTILVPDLCAPYSVGSGRSCSQRDDATLEHHYHFDVFVKVIEYQVNELESRFNDEAMELLTLTSALDPHNHFKSFDIDNICRLAQVFYPHDFIGNDVDGLRSELEHYELDVVAGAQFQNITTISELCETLVRTRKSKVFVMIDKLIRLVLTLSVSTASTERAFSAMKILKTDLRSKMDDAFLGDIMVIYIERQFAKKISIESMIDEFDDMGDRRVKFR
ncbi:hypothetical protein OROHE_023516 [Orobanche hederae]